MNKGKHFCPVLIFPLILLSGCATTGDLTRAEAFPLMYEEQPHVIVVLPPVNLTSAPEASDYFHSSITESLNLLGYYAVPPEIVLDALLPAGLGDARDFEDSPLKAFNEAFGADAVLFTTIHEWEKQYAGIASSIRIIVDARLKSAHSDRVLWSYRGEVMADISSESSTGRFLDEYFAAMIVPEVSFAATDMVDFARLACARLLSSLPAGTYSPGHLADGDAVVRIPPGVEIPAQQAVSTD